MNLSKDIVSTLPTTSNNFSLSSLEEGNHLCHCLASSSLQPIRRPSNATR